MPDLLPVPPPLGWRARVEALLGRGPLRTAHLVSLAAGALVVLGTVAAVVVWIVRTPPTTESVIPQATAPRARLSQRPTRASRSWCRPPARSSAPACTGSVAILGSWT